MGRCSWGGALGEVLLWRCSCGGAPGKVCSCGGAPGEVLLVRCSWGGATGEVLLGGCSCGGDRCALRSWLSGSVCGADRDVRSLMTERGDGERGGERRQR